MVGLVIGATLSTSGGDGQVEQLAVDLRVSEQRVEQLRGTAETAQEAVDDLESRLLAADEAARSSAEAEESARRELEAIRAAGSAATAGESGTVALIRARDSLVCGVSDSAPGFSVMQANGTADGFDADYCRAVAAAVLGDASKVTFRSLTAVERFAALRNGDVDVLFRKSSWTQSRDTDLGLDFGPTTYFDGQQMMGVAARLPGLTPASGFEAIDGATVCANAGTTSEKNITEGAAAAGVTITLESVETLPDALAKLQSGACDIITTDGSVLYASRAAALVEGEIQTVADWLIFPSAPFTLEPLGPVYRENDSTWADIVNWTVYSTVVFDAAGVTSANVENAAGLSPEVSRLLGGEGQLQTSMGLAPDAFLQVVRQVGSYGEVFERNLTIPLGIERNGTLNTHWFEGGQLFAPPAR